MPMPFALQPFYLNLVESGKAYVQVEQERDRLRADMERLNRKLISLLASKVLCAMLHFAYYEPYFAIFFRREDSG